MAARRPPPPPPPRRGGRLTAVANSRENQDLHNRVAEMVTPNAFSNTALTRRSTTNDGSHHRATDADDDEDTDDDITSHNIRRASTLPSVASPPPSTVHDEDRELERAAKRMDLLEREARLNAYKNRGHIYGDLFVTDDARALSGNILNSDDLEAVRVAKHHEYGHTRTEKRAKIYRGDVFARDLDRIWIDKNPSNHIHHGDRPGSQRGPSY